MLLRRAAGPPAEGAAILAGIACALVASFVFAPATRAAPLRARPARRRPAAAVPRMADAPSFCFQSARKFFGVKGAQKIATADFDGDGHADVVTANVGPTVSVLLGDGHGQLGAPTDSPTSDVAGIAIRTADFDGDGKPDVAVGGNGVAILLGASGGHFGTPSVFLSGRGIRELATGDFDGNGTVDLAAVDGFSAKVFVLLGDGSGGFTQGPALQSAGDQIGIAVGDVDGDGSDDVIASDPAAASILAFLNKGGGTFAPPLFSAAGTSPGAVTLVDITGDGRLDAVVADAFPSEALVLAGNGAGGFSLAQSVPIGLSPVAFGVGDLNGDGRADVVAGNQSSASLSILLGNPAHGLSPSATYLAGVNALGVALADFNEDGRLDVATADQTDVAVLFGDGTGKATGVRAVGEIRGSAEVVAADVNRDGIPDVVGLGSVFVGAGDGSFGGPIEFPVPNAFGNQPMAMADIDGDGTLDLAIASPAYPGFATYLGDGAGHFGSPHPYFAGTDAFMPVFADFTGDGRPDVALGTLGQVIIAVNQGDGTFSLDPAMDVSSESLVAADFNADGKVDLAVANAGTSFQILIGNGDGTFQSPATFDVLPGVALSIVAADFDGDGDQDLALACTFANEIVTLHGDGTGGFGGAVVHELSEPFDINGGPGILTVADFDGDGRVDVAGAGFTRIAFLKGDGTGNFATPIEIPVPSNAIAAADFDGDGRVDLATGFGGILPVGILQNIRPIVSPAALPSGTLGVPYPAATFTATGGLLPLSLAISGAPPPGLQFDPATATLSGTPTAVGTFAFSVSAESPLGCATTRDYSVAIAPFPATVVFRVSPNPAAAGQAVVLTATVGPIPPGGPAPTGTVTFRDGDVVLGVVPLVDGVATLRVENLSNGHHSLTAEFSGDANFGGNVAGFLASVGVAPIPALGATARGLLILALAAIAVLRLRWMPPF